MFKNEVKGFKYEVLPCPFCQREPQVRLDDPTNWDGRCWAWINCGCYMSLHKGDCRSMFYENHKYELVQHRTKEQAQQEALNAVCKTWNTREPW